MDKYLSLRSLCYTDQIALQFYWSSKRIQYIVKWIWYFSSLFVWILNTFFHSPDFQSLARVFAIGDIQKLHDLIHKWCPSFCFDICDQKSGNLQYDTLGCWDDRLIDQASDVPSIFFIISFKILCKNPFNLFFHFLITL